MRKRNINLDLIRVVAVLSVLSVHFFLNTSYYSTPLTGGVMYVGTLVRTACMVCVPLFLLLSGYLMNKKQFSKEYFFNGGLNRVLIIYLISTIVILLYRSHSLDLDFSLLEIVRSLLTFEHYSWYIEMYIGLYLLIPIINIVYWALSYEQKKMTIVILLCITTLPFFVVYERTTIMPVFWRNLYPITYYAIGALLCEYSDKLNVKAWKGLLLFVIGIIMGGTYNYQLSREGTFIVGNWTSWGNMFNVMASIGLFIFLLKLNMDRMPEVLKKIIILISKVSLSIYLISYVSDSILYPILKEYLNEFVLQFKYMPVMVGSSFIIALLLALVVDFIATMGITAWTTFVKRM